MTFDKNLLMNIAYIVLIVAGLFYIFGQAKDALGIGL